ncbi:MAG: glycosyltransferase [Bryobacteraceae bacterium]|jgi:glycosyltransferase involved in cell wall biosynthesis
MQLIFWQSILSPHQAPYIRALAARAACNVTVIAERAMTPDRAAIGWTVPNLGAARIVLTTDRRTIETVIQESPRDSIHILQGIRGCRLVEISFPLLRQRSARSGILSESGAAKGLGAVSDVGTTLRRARCTFQALRHAASIDFILAMGNEGVRWFRTCAFSPERIFPFGYVTDASTETTEESEKTRAAREFTIAFVGRLVWLKGGDLLIRSLASAPACNWRLIIVGEGEDRSAWQRLAAKLQISDQVTFTGVLPNKDVKAVIASADLLVLPTRFDGWGTVVNEALMQGVPVLCSDRCGARDLLNEAWRGEVFKAGSVGSLRQALAKWIARGKRTRELTERIRHWSCCIEGESVADYFANVLRHVYDGAPRPIAPWYCSGSTHD